MPSRSTIRLGGGSSTAGAGTAVVLVSGGVALWTSGSGVADGAGVSFPAAAMAGWLVMVSATGGGSVGVAAAGASCFRYCAATNPYALVGASISSQSPLALT